MYPYYNNYGDMSCYGHYSTDNGIALALPWGNAAFTPMRVTPKVRHERVIQWFTSGFE